MAEEADGGHVHGEMDIRVHREMWDTFVQITERGVVACFVALAAMAFGIIVGAGWIVVLPVTIVGLLVMLLPLSMEVRGIFLILLIGLTIASL